MFHSSKLFIIRQPIIRDNLQLFFYPGPKSTTFRGRGRDLAAATWRRCGVPASPRPQRPRRVQVRVCPRQGCAVRSHERGKPYHIPEGRVFVLKALVIAHNLWRVGFQEYVIFGSMNLGVLNRLEKKCDPFFYESAIE